MPAGQAPAPTPAKPTVSSAGLSGAAQAGCGPFCRQPLSNPVDMRRRLTGGLSARARHDPEDERIDSVLRSSFRHRHSARRGCRGDRRRGTRGHEAGARCIHARRGGACVAKDRSVARVSRIRGSRWRGRPPTPVAGDADLQRAGARQLSTRRAPRITTAVVGRGGGWTTPLESLALLGAVGSAAGWSDIRYRGLRRARVQYRSPSRPWARAAPQDERRAIHLQIENGVTRAAVAISNSSSGRR